LRGAIAQRVISRVPPATPAQRRAAVQAGLDALLSYGVTSFTDALSQEEDMSLFAALADAGKLRQRAKICIRWDGAAANAASEALIDNRARFARERIRTDCVKLYTDGAPMIHTARMLQPYVNDAQNTGKWTIEPEQLKALVTRFDARGLTLKIHATGDDSARSALDAIEYVRKINGWSGQLHEVAHNSFVAAADLHRARAIGATLEFSPYIWYPTPLEDIATRAAVGDERMERVHPVREAIEAGALVVGGSDWPFAASPSPWLGMETLVTRRVPGGNSHAVGEREAITLQQAVDMFTTNAARGLGMRDELGAIEPGLRADLVVLDRNPFDIPITDVHATRAKLVFIEGERVYEKK
jgi:predicted amidohydrolase YtcJ